uniref:Cilia and flagella associated protein 20 n=1 Tax=Cyprinus carpio carpio TaxID=630221 RepID=A0A9J7YJF8_CYPCA
MFKNTFQSGFLSILYSIGSKPLQIWDKKVRNGHIKRITDNDIQSLVLEVEGTNVSTTYITCPADPKKTLGIKLPFLVMIIKNLKKYFTFEVQVLDDKNVRRRFRASNYQSTTRVKPFICTMPMRLDDGWNQIQFNLSDFTRRAYGTNYIETLRVQVFMGFVMAVLVTFRFMQTVASGGCISLTGCTLRTSSPLNLNSIYQYKTKQSSDSRLDSFISSLCFVCTCLYWMDF